jgi:DNA recombination protein RmuC
MTTGWFVLFAESPENTLENIGQWIEQAQDGYGKARKRLPDKRGDLLRQIEMVRELGVENSKELPEAMKKGL